ncbi:MAG TPA: HIT family protein [Chloroflexia bacterium]|nr:HIT family protein [Chloroflexia bacterium]
MGDCVFCDIIERRVPASIVYEDEVFMAFMTIEPVNPGHVLVIPKEHVAVMSDMDEDTGMHLFKITLRVQQAIRQSGVKCEGMNLFLADEKAAFQEVMHLHMHVFPRFEGDSFKLAAGWSARPRREELDVIAASIHRAYESLWGASK